MKFQRIISYRDSTKYFFLIFKRFPLTFSLSFLLVGLTIFKIELNEHESLDYTIARFLLSLLIALPLQIGAEWLLAQYRHTLSQAWRLAPLAAGGLYYPLAGYFNADLIRFSLVFSSTILLLVLLASGWNRSAQDFSRRLSSIFIAFLIAGLAGGVMNAGIFSVLFSIKELLEITLPEKIYLYTSLILHGVFTLGIFVSLLPENDKSQENSPPWIDFILRAVLVPVLSLYGIVLAIYFGKILISQTFPKGTVAINISVYAFVGLISALLANGYQRPLYTRFFRWFYISLLLFIPMLVAGVIRRIQDYGFTEGRILLLLFACILAWIAIMTGVVRKNRPQWIVGIFAIIAVAAVLSPLNIFTLSLASQKSRFDELISQHHLVINKKFISKPKELNVKEYEELQSTLRYLVKTHGSEIVRPLLPADWNLSPEEPWKDRNLSNSIVSRIAFQSPQPYKKTDGTRSFTLRNSSWNETNTSAEIFPCLFALEISGRGTNPLLYGLNLDVSEKAIRIISTQNKILLEVTSEALAQHAEEQWNRENKKIQNDAFNALVTSRQPSSHFVTQSSSVKLALGLQNLTLSSQGYIIKIRGNAYVQVDETYCKQNP